MSFGNLLKNIGKGLSNIQNENRANPNEQTAHGSIFDKIKGALEDMKEKAASTNRQPQQDETIERETMEPLDMLKKKIEEVKTQNSADPDVPTAEESVFDRMKRMIEEQAAADQAETANTAPSNEWNSNSNPTPTPAPPSPPPAAEAMGSFAMTNSQGGSLAIRQTPDMGAPTNSVRIPEDSKVKILEYSKETINIDGQNSRWAKVDFDGTVGWILEIYLNFN